MPETYYGPVSVRLAPGKGRGVFTTRAIQKDEVLCIDACLVLDPGERQAIRSTILSHYYFVHPVDDALGCVVLGPTSLMNHADEPNCRVQWEEDESGWTITILAKYAMPPDQELTIDYGCELWFDAQP